ncbi:hypothetical protein ONS95_011845 [Cadophora gregata]|uniref:uncharacterized protein n=1 Tax=Cadophora gregata TaxID=51156 RepID=UPI0026DC5AB4|nr:uncharacterized protein ONS95_011845 [Cadophora gregata]KAK0117505.1 hypothetical protein ONS95_011845 [Cadophora gregata]KAK0122560.1 hypothetical protein ONS96_009602 [Cadophora gregata f. sp. sojae]
MLRCIVISLIGTKNIHKVTRHVFSLKPSIVARQFHVIPPYRSSCDFGGPCDCSECRADRRRSICDICDIRPAVEQSYEWSRDRKGISGYSSTSFCEQCWEDEQRRQKKEEQEMKRKRASRKKSWDEMMRRVRGLASAEQVPVAYAVEKLKDVWRFNNSRGWYQRHLIYRMLQDLQIVKVRNRYMCNKRRVDAMDFKLWVYGEDLYLEDEDLDVDNENPDVDN